MTYNDGQQKLDRYGNSKEEEKSIESNRKPLQVTQEETMDYKSLSHTIRPIHGFLLRKDLSGSAGILQGREAGVCQPQCQRRLQRPLRHPFPVEIPRGRHCAGPWGIRLPVPADLPVVLFREDYHQHRRLGVEAGQVERPRPANAQIV